LKCGRTSSTEIAVRHTPSTAITPPTHHRRRETAYQMPIPAMTSGISSFVNAARTAKTANAASRSSSRYQKAKRSSGHASATGWNSFSVSHCTAGYRRYASASPSAACSDPRCFRASQKTGSAPSAIATACAATSIAALGQIHHSGANATRIGSTCEPSRETCSPWRFVI